MNDNKIIYESEGYIWNYDIVAKKTQDLGEGWNAEISPDEKKLVYISSDRKKAGEQWINRSNLLVRDISSEKVVKLSMSDINEELWAPSWSLDGKKIIFIKTGLQNTPYKSESSLWSVSPDGLNLKKLTDNASSPKWASMPGISFISPSLAKILILSVIAFTGILSLFGIFLIARKTIKAVVPEVKVASRSVFCTQCGKQNPASATYCTICGEKLK